MSAVVLGVKKAEAPRLLVFNCHEAWVHQLEGIGYELDIVVGLPGRAVATWDERMRPVPAGARLLSLDEALAARTNYAAAVLHSVTDLLDAKALDCPKLIVIHNTLEGRVADQEGADDAPRLAETLKQFLSLTSVRAVAVSALKARSWGVADEVLPFGVDPELYLPHKGELARGIRVSNQFRRRRNILLVDLHEQAFSGLPMTLVGHNSDIADSGPARDWPHLKELLSTHRFYVHTADPKLEDGYNMASLEAMASGLPVLGNVHPSSPIVHGKSGYSSNDPEQLRRYAEQLLSDPELAARLGAEAKRVVGARFHVRSFRAGFRGAIANAQKRYRKKAQRALGAR
ncbi:MAG: glycosyltransferase [Polyangiaceae bacterium]